jgi:PKD repeat protein
MAVAQNIGIGFTVSHYHTCDTVVSLTFRDHSVSPYSPIVFRKWEFGDGAVDSSGQIVKHTYTRRGVYVVRLTVRDADGRTGSSLYAEDYTIRIGTGVKLPAVAYLCNNEGYPVTINNLAAPDRYDSLGTYAWYNKYDQLVSTDRRLTTADSGRYTLQYTVCGTTASASTSVLHTSGDLAISAGTYVWAYDTATVLFSVPNMPYTSGYDKVTWKWGDGMSQSFPDSVSTAHSYFKPGAYNVSFAVRLPQLGACDTISNYNLTLRQPYVTHNAWNGTDFLMEGGMYEMSAGNPGATYEWGSTDPGFHANTQTIIIEEEGKFWVKISKDGDVIIDTLNMKYPPVPWMELKSRYISTCSDTAVIVANVHNKPSGYTVAWNNGVISDSIYVNKPGIYSAVLKDETGSVIDADTINVSVNKGLNAKIEIHHSPDPANDTLIAYPQSQSSGIYFYRWYRNGMEITSGNYPMLHDLAPGIYNVSVLSNEGCYDISDSIHYQSANGWTLDARIEKMTPCGDSALLIAAATSPNSNYTISWNTGQQSSSSYVTTSGRYIATLKDLQGNIQAVDSVEVDLKPLVARLEMHPSATPGNDTLISFPYNYGYYHRWWRNGIPFRGGPDAITNYPTPGVYQVYIRTDEGCELMSDTLHYKMDGPELPVDLTYEISRCDAQTVEFAGRVDTQDPIVNYSWNFGDEQYMEAPFPNMGHHFAPGIYNIALTVTTSSGRAGSITKHVTVHADQEIWTGKISKQSNLCGDTVWLTGSGSNPKTGHLTWSTGEQGSTIVVTKSGRYGLDVHDSCYQMRAVDTVDVIINAPCIPNIPGDTIDIGNGPIEGGKVLPVTAGFDHGFNADNIFTVQLTLQDPGGRETGIQPDEVINLGSMRGTTKDITMQVDIPDTLACATSYAVRVVASSPADTTAWSQLFTIANQPAQPVITQRGDSLFTSGKYNWQWYFNDKAIEGATSATYRARANGSYTVESLNGNDCSSKSSPVSVIITAVGEVTLGGNKVKAFPNPSEGQVSLQFEKPLLKAVTINVYNMNGRVMYTRTTTQQLQPLDLSGLPKGYYLIELTGYGEKKVLSLILQ